MIDQGDNSVMTSQPSLGINYANFKCFKFPFLNINTVATKSTMSWTVEKSSLMPDYRYKGFHKSITCMHQCKISHSSTPLQIHPY